MVHKAESGSLAGVVNVNTIVCGALLSGYLGYAEFAAHAGRGLMTEGLSMVLDSVSGSWACIESRRTSNLLMLARSP